MKKRPDQEEFGDFQTPSEAARACCEAIAALDFRPASVLEPTCGTGNFLAAALSVFPETKTAMGVDINPGYLKAAESAVKTQTGGAKVRLIAGDFFRLDWNALIGELPDPLLVVGNPPWVTNSSLARISGSNLPVKTNLRGGRGIDAMTGEGTFDISEWMLLKLIEAMRERNGTLALLCKTAVARRVLRCVWESGRSPSDSRTVKVPAREVFRVAVDACFLVLTMPMVPGVRDCAVYESFDARFPIRSFGLRNGRMVSDTTLYHATERFEGGTPRLWRSGVKHDCAAVMELRRDDRGYRNGLGEYVALEDSRVYPMLKSSDLANHRDAGPSRRMIVPQRTLGEDTAALAEHAPKTWAYLNAHADLLDRRRSAVYRNRPRFAVFGVGEYTFSPWKTAISGFYKQLDFRVVEPHDGKPVVLDDTCCFLPCRSGEEAALLAHILNSPEARAFYSSRIFRDEKRPITIRVLRRLDLVKLAEALGAGDRLRLLPNPGARGGPEQPRASDLHR